MLVSHSKLLGAIFVLVVACAKSKNHEVGTHPTASREEFAAETPDGATGRQDSDQRYGEGRLAFTLRFAGQDVRVYYKEEGGLALTSENEIASIKCGMVEVARREDGVWRTGLHPSALTTALVGPCSYKEGLHERVATATCDERGNCTILVETEYPVINETAGSGGSLEVNLGVKLCTANIDMDDDGKLSVTSNCNQIDSVTFNGISMERTGPGVYFLVSDERAGKLLITMADGRVLHRDVNFEVAVWGDCVVSPHEPEGQPTPIHDVVTPTPTPISTSTPDVASASDLPSI